MAKLADTTDMSLADASGYLRTHALPLRAILTLCDRLGEVELLNQQLVETEKAIVDKRADLERVNADIINAEHKLEDANNGIDDAKQTASEIIAKAKAEAQKLIDNGKADAQAAADAVANTAAKSLAGIQSKIETARTDLDTFNGQISDKRKALADLEAQATDAEGRAQKARDFIASLKG